MYRIKFLLISMTLALLGTVSFARPATALFESAKNDACSGIALSSRTVDCGDASADTNNVLSSGINIFSLAVGVIAIIMIVYGGLKYITSGGDATAITNARNTLIYAIIGIIIVALSQIIVRFVISRSNQELPACPAGTTQINNPGDCTP